MFKLIGKVIGIIIILAIIFIALALWQGGEPFRWIGNKSEQAGEVIREKSEAIGKEADRIKEKTDDMKEKTNEVSDGIMRTKNAIKDLTGSKSEK
jgi:hypothetical protein